MAGEEETKEETKVETPESTPETKTPEYVTKEEFQGVKDLLTSISDKLSAPEPKKEETPEVKTEAPAPEPKKERQAKEEAEKPKEKTKPKGFGAWRR